MNKLSKLKENDLVDVIAPASRCTDKSLTELKELLLSWKLKVRIADDIFGNDLLCANSDEARFQGLKNALLNSESKAVICARGGYGCARVITELNTVTPPSNQKLFIGMSDITVLNLFLQQKWHWPVIHGALAPDRFSKESITAVKSIIFDEVKQVKFTGLPLNKLAEKKSEIEAVMTGGNLSIIQTSIGTFWQMDGKHKIILMEDVDERGYRIDRMLEHLRQVGVFKDASAIVFGDFTGGAEPNGSFLIDPVLKRFAESCEMPVIKIEGIGHDSVNFPMPLGTKTKLILGDEIDLVCSV